MKMSQSSNPGCRRLTLSFVMDMFGSLENWARFLKSKGMDDETITRHMMHCGFLDEEADGALIGARQK